MLVKRFQCQNASINYNGSQLQWAFESLRGGICQPLQKKRYARHTIVARNHHGVVQFSRGVGRPGDVTFCLDAAMASVASPAPKQTTMQRFASAGLAGLVAYGLSNTIYYTVAFLAAWMTMASAPKGQGLAAAVMSSAKLIAVVWAGSQVTKVPRMAAALMMAPLADKLLLLIQKRFQFKSKKDAFLQVILPSCLVLAFAVFGIVLFLWA